MEFQKDAKVKSVNVLLSVVKWFIWLTTAGLCLLLASAYTGNEGDGYMMTIALVAIGGGYLGVAVGKYQNMIIKDDQ